MPKANIFNQHHEQYDEWFEKHHDMYRAELTSIKSMIAIHGAGLEIGVGSGKFAVPLGITTGVEPSVEMAKKAARQGIKVYNAVAEQLPFDNDTFDFAIMVTTICFVDDPQKSICEAYRVIKPDGFCIIAIVDKGSNLGKQYLKNKDKSTFYKEATFFSTSEIVNLMTNAGYSNFQFKQTLFDDENPFRIEDGYTGGSFVVIKGYK